MDVNKVFIWLMLVISISANPDDDYGYDDYNDEYVEPKDCELFSDYDFR